LPPIDWDLITLPAVDNEHAMNNRLNAAGWMFVNRPENTSHSAFLSANDEPSWIRMSSNRAIAA